VARVTDRGRIIRRPPDRRQRYKRAFLARRGVLMKTIDKNLDDWRAQLSPEQFQVCRLGATERPFSGQYNDCDRPGVYHGVCCDQPLFDSATKFDAGCGWPSYYQPISPQAVMERTDNSH